MRICANCFSDEEVKSYISFCASEEGICDYCGKRSKLLDISELYDFFSGFIGVFEPSCNGGSLIDTIQKDWHLFSSNQVGKRILWGVLNSVHSAINSPTEKVSYLKSILDCVAVWDEFKTELEFSKRFMTDTDKLFENEWDSLLNKPNFFSSNAVFYRARINTGGSGVPYRCKDMLCPKPLDTKGGRANPLGIPYLYLSDSLKTTLYEIKPNYLDIVSIGKICLKKKYNNINFKDFTALESPFLQENMEKVARSRLLNMAISHDLSKPIHSFDTELEYIPTQFVCEFLKFSTDVDGIIFQSSLYSKGKNFVCFTPSKFKCTQVSCYEINKHELDASILFNNSCRD